LFAFLLEDTLGFTVADFFALTSLFFVELIGDDGEFFAITNLEVVDLVLGVNGVSKGTKTRSSSSLTAFLGSTFKDSLDSGKRIFRIQLANKATEAKIIKSKRIVTMPLLKKPV
jgi:hypothetical protein